MSRPRLLTGDRATGRLHLGHYVGSLALRVVLQDECDVFILIADVQALTDHFDRPEILLRNIRHIVADYLAAGIDPERSTIFVQSLVPEIAELAFYYLNLVTVARLQRNPTVKEELRHKGWKRQIPTGFLVYPVHQAADITVVRAELVPVGTDQLPMIEQTVELVRRFNALYGKVLVEPRAKIGDVARLPGLDGKTKMGKSLGNAIFLADEPETVEAKVMRMYTDPRRIRATDPGHVEGNPVFVYHDAFNEDTAEVAQLKADYVKGRVSDVEVKRRLARALNRFLAPIRDRRERLGDDPACIDDILQHGTRRARTAAQETMDLVRSAMRINYPFRV